MIRRISVFFFACALVALALPAAANDFAVVPQAAYSADESFGPFESTTAHVLFALDVDTLTGTTPTYRLCMQVQEAIDSTVSPQLVTIGCSTAVNTQAANILQLFSPSYAATAQISEAAAVPVPMRYWVLLDLEGTTPVLTGHVSASEIQ